MKDYRIRYDLRKHDKQMWEPAPHMKLDISETRKPNRSLVVIRNFLSPEEIQLVHQMGAHPGVNKIEDRKKNLAYQHTAFRIEVPMRIVKEKLYHKVISGGRWADDKLWGKLMGMKKFYPEIEYIVYDVKEFTRPHIEPHVDNYSVVTMVCMLSDTTEFVGGVNCFKGDKGTTEERRFKLEQGDAVFFRGERLSHWITPVESGRRMILQCEFSRI